MAFGSGIDTSILLEEISTKVSESQIAGFYLGVSKIPCVIKSPLRQDNHPSMSIYSPDGGKVSYFDFATKEKGRLYGLLSKMWNLSYEDTLKKINNDMILMKNDVSIEKSKNIISVSNKNKSETDIQCKVREWKDYDLAYWNGYGISKEQLIYANVYPVSKIIRLDGNKRTVFNADKYAYAYIEYKDNKTTMKIYQPFNQEGFKWTNKHDKSVISLWTKIPDNGDIVCICSSMKDALCLWANTGIPSIAIQGEGYPISKSAKNELIKRFKNVCVCLDNDKAGLEDAKKLCEETGFTNIILPQFKGGKDISDFYKIINNKSLFKNKILKLFENGLRKTL